MFYYLYWDESAHGDNSKLCRSTYTSLKDAKAQAENDIIYGRRVLYIEKSERELKGEHRSSIHRGEVVWKPKKV